MQAEAIFHIVYGEASSEQEDNALQSGFTTSETLPPAIRVHVVGAGPVGLLLTALLQPLERFSLHSMKSAATTLMPRMVQIASYSWRIRSRATCPITSMKKVSGPSSIHRSSSTASRFDGPFLRT